MLRKVLFRKFINHVWIHQVTKKEVERYTTEDSIYLSLKEGTGCYQDDFKTKGFFHQWGVDFTEFEQNAGNFMLALIEDEGGRVHKVLPENFKFIDTLKH